jgi:hypothetical protein
MSDSADAVREEVDCREACMQQAYNYLHATNNCFALDCPHCSSAKPMYTSVKTLDDPGDIKAPFSFEKFGFTFAT